MSKELASSPLDCQLRLFIGHKQKRWLKDHTKVHATSILRHDRRCGLLALLSSPFKSGGTYVATTHCFDQGHIGRCPSCFGMCG